MNSPLTRAQLLFHQSRYAQAELEVRRALNETPHEPGAHALLAMCLAQQEKLDEAQEEAQQAIVLAPDWAYAHFCRSVVLEHRKRFAEAEASAREAVRLEPIEPDYQARLAATLFYQQKWKETLAAADEGLRHDAEHEDSSHLRTMALTKLGRQSAAVAAVDAVLQRAPDDAMAHTNKGWALLHQRKPREALEHFREALRIDPNFEYARAGIVEALKSRNPIYRWMLAYFLWMARLSDRARWGVIIGGYVAYRLLRGVARSNPETAPWIMPFLFAYIAFALLTWFAYPLFNMLLRFNKFGWYALSSDQRAASNWFGACLALCISAIAASFIWDTPVALLTAGFAIGLALPLVTIHQCDIGWPRQAMTAFTAAMAAVGLATLLGAAFDQEWSLKLLPVFLLGFIATPWLANYLASATATK